MRHNGVEEANANESARNKKKRNDNNITFWQIYLNLMYKQNIKYRAMQSYTQSCK